MSILRITKRLLPSYRMEKLLTDKNPRMTQVLCHMVHIKPQEFKPPTKNYPDYQYEYINMERGRPMTPYISIYAPQIQGVMSVTNRVTGAVWTFQLAAFAIAVLILPESIDYYVDKINSWNLDPAIIFSCKVLNSFPVCYHTIDGLRHLLWDLGLTLNTPFVTISGWVLVVLIFISTIYLSLL